MDFEEFRQRLFLQICDKKDLDVNYSHLKEGSFLQKKNITKTVDDLDYNG